MILIPLDGLRAVSAAAEAAYPEEACGLLVGRRIPGGHARVTRVEAAVNVAADRRTGFEVDPGLRIGLERELRGTDQAIVGHYHSHPDGPARPSATDLAKAFEPDLIWLIVAVVRRQASQVLAFTPRLDRSGFREIAIHAVEGAPKVDPRRKT